MQSFEVVGYSLVTIGCITVATGIAVGDNLEVDTEHTTSMEEAFADWP